MVLVASTTGERRTRRPIMIAAGSGSDVSERTERPLCHDGIVLPWDTKKSGTAYYMSGVAVEISRRDLPPPKKKR